MIHKTSPEKFIFSKIYDEIANEFFHKKFSKFWKKYLHSCKSRRLMIPVYIYTIYIYIYIHIVYIYIYIYIILYIYIYYILYIYMSCSRMQAMMTYYKLLISHSLFLSRIRYLTINICLQFTVATLVLQSFWLKYLCLNLCYLPYKFWWVMDVAK